MSLHDDFRGRPIVRGEGSNIPRWSGVATAGLSGGGKIRWSDDRGGGADLAATGPALPRRRSAGAMDSGQSLRDHGRRNSSRVTAAATARREHGP